MAGIGTNAGGTVYRAEEQLSAKQAHIANCHVEINEKDRCKVTQHQSGESRRETLLSILCRQKSALLTQSYAINPDMLEPYTYD